MQESNLSKKREKNTRVKKNKTSNSKNHLFKKYEYTLLKKIGATLDLNLLLKFLADEIKTYFQPDNFLITIYDDQKKNLIIKYLEFSEQYRKLQDTIANSKYPIDKKDPIALSYMENRVINISRKNITAYDEIIQNRFNLWNIEHGIILPFFNNFSRYKTNKKNENENFLTFLEKKINDLSYVEGYYIAIKNRGEDNYRIQKIKLPTELNSLSEVLLNKNIPSSEFHFLTLLPGKYLYFDKENLKSLAEINLSENWKIKSGFYYLYEKEGLGMAILVFSSTKSSEVFSSQSLHTVIPTYFKRIDRRLDFEIMSETQSSNSSIGSIFIFNHNKKVNLERLNEFKKILTLFFKLVENAITFNSLQNQEKQIRIATEKNQKIFELAEKINNIISIELIYENILHSIFNLYGFNLGFVFMDNGILLEYVSGAYVEDDQLKRIFDQTSAYFLKVGGYEKKITDGATALGFIRNNHYYIPDVKAVLNLPMAQKDREGIRLLEDPRSLLILPILKDKNPVGVIQLWSIQKKNYLTESDIQSLKTLGGFIGIAIANSKIYSLVEKQKKEVEEKNRKIALDLLLARRIQKNLIPLKIKSPDNLEIVSCYIPMHEVGGDYFDSIFDLSTGNVSIIITDASGHGVPAAFITSMVKIAYQSDKIKTIIHSPSAVLQEINHAVYHQLAGNFVTIFCCYIDVNNNKIRFSSAGHPSAFLLDRLNKSLTPIRTKGKSIGFFLDSMYEEIEIPFSENSRLFLYTDGLIEAENNAGENFQEQLEFILKDTVSLTPEECKEAILLALKKHTGLSAEQSYEDDIAFLIIDYI